MQDLFFKAVTAVVGEDTTLNEFREKVIENELEGIKNMIESNAVDINADLSVGKLGNLSTLTPSWMKGVHEENADSLEYRALHWAARKGYLDQLKYLCEKGANVNIVNFIGNTPLHVACYYNQKEAIKIILMYKPNVNRINTGSYLANVKENFTPLHYAALYGDAESIEILLKAGAVPDIKGSCDLTPLHLAASVGDIEKINSLLSVEQDINCVDSDGKTPLHHAVLASLTNPRAVEVVLFLLERQAMPNLVDNKGHTPLESLVVTANEQMLDITTEQLQVAQHLLTWGADEERFNRCIYDTQSINFSLELNYFLIKQCAQQKTYLLAPEKKAEEAKTPLESSQQNILSTPISNALTTDKPIAPLPSNAPMIKRAAPPPPPPANKAPRKKYRENIDEGKVVKNKPAPTSTDDLMAALMKRLEERRKDIAPLSETHDESSEDSKDEWENKGKSLSPVSKK